MHKLASIFGFFQKPWLQFYSFVSVSLEFAVCNYGIKLLQSEDPNKSQNSHRDNLVHVLL
jgi:hypothetical protein